MPLLAVPLLAGTAGEAVDARTLRFLLARPLAEKEVEEEQRKVDFARQVEELRQASLARAEELCVDFRKTLVVDMSLQGERETGAAKRRRERELRS